MRIYTHPNGEHYVNAIYGQDESLAGKLYRLQAGPNTFDIDFQDRKFEDGAVGLLNEQLLEVLLHRLGVLQAKKPCPENVQARAHLEEALALLQCRERQLSQ